MSEGVRGAPTLETYKCGALAHELLRAGLETAARTPAGVGRRIALSVAGLAVIDALDRAAPGLKAEIGRALRPCVEFDDARRAREVREENQ